MITNYDVQQLPRLFGGRVVGELYYGAWVKVVRNQNVAVVTAYGQESVVTNVSSMHLMIQTLISKKHKY